MIPFGDHCPRESRATFFPCYIMYYFLRVVHNNVNKYYSPQHRETMILFLDAAREVRYIYIYIEMRGFLFILQAWKRLISCSFRTKFITLIHTSMLAKNKSKLKKYTVNESPLITSKIIF